MVCTFVERAVEYCVFGRCKGYVQGPACPQHQLLKCWLCSITIRHTCRRARCGIRQCWRSSEQQSCTLRAPDNAARTMLAPQEDYPAPLPKSALSNHGDGRGGAHGGGRRGGRGGRAGRGHGERNSRHGGSNKGRPRSDFERFG